MASDTGDISVLRAKYLDWYSARIADLLLRSSPEDIYALAHGDMADDAESRESASKATYRAGIARATDELAARADLPDFESWLVAYRAEPERYEREMFGFWRSRLNPAGERDTGATTRQ